MKDIRRVNNPHNDDKVIDACSIFGAMDTSGRRFSGEGVIKAIANMHDRGNGLGGGFTVYGLYPEYADFYALHVMYLKNLPPFTYGISRRRCEGGGWEKMHTAVGGRGEKRKRGFYTPLKF